MQGFDPILISKVVSNSFLITKEGAKSGRLDGANRSLIEAETGLTKRGSLEHGRILLGLDDEKKLIVLDGRHLLHAFLTLKKEIPFHTIGFESDETYRLFQHVYFPGPVIS